MKQEERDAELQWRYRRKLWIENSITHEELLEELRQYIKQELERDATTPQQRWDEFIHALEEEKSNTYRTVNGHTRCRVPRHPIVQYLIDGRKDSDAKGYLR